MTRRDPNRLSRETSPYLLQHASNPVDWFPWGDEALARARQLDRPIFLSVGYAACHWCHVMERESFQDEATAALLNERFISVKVDREERPDIDAVYMDAVQTMSGHGGWPMSVWLTPDGRPFYAGTYFPDEPRHGMPSFRQVLEALAEAWETRRAEIEAQGAHVTSSIGRAAELTPSDGAIDAAVTEQAFVRLRSTFDPHWGGFGGAPKFPQPMVLEFVLRMAVRGSTEALEMATTTLDRMADGGIHDQIGGGFARYSIDAAWHVPHFEKMLYDNAQLARLYTQAWLHTRNGRYREVAWSTLEYLLREMRHPDGGFFSSQDADSEGVEGKFFTWGWDELVATIGEPVARSFGATPEGNWEGTNVLWRPTSASSNGGSLGVEPEALTDSIEQVRHALFDIRQERVRPATDDKIVTAWNALAIRAFAEAGGAFGDQAATEVATRCAEFVWAHLRDASGRLLRSWRDGTPGRPGFADDYALVAGAFLTLYEATGDVTWFSRGRRIADALIASFLDGERGGFHQTGNDAERLVVRTKDLQDNAAPSGNSAAAEALLRLALLTGDAGYERAAMSALRLVLELLRRSPHGFGVALNATDLVIGPSREIAVIGDRASAGTDALITEVRRNRFLPNTVLAVAAPDDTEAFATVPLLEGRSPVEGRPTAYVCERFACRTPATSPRDLIALL